MLVSGLTPPTTSSTGRKLTSPWLSPQSSNAFAIGVDTPAATRSWITAVRLGPSGSTPIIGPSGVDDASSFTNLQVGHHSDLIGDEGHIRFWG